MAVIVLALVFATSCAPQPAPLVVLTVTPATQNFGNVYVGTTRWSAAVTWTNTGQAPLEILGVLPDPSPPFTLLAPAPAMPLTLAPTQGTPRFVFLFTPRAAGPVTGGATPQSIQIVLPDIAQEIAFTGNGVVQVNTGTVAISGGDLVAGQVLDFGPVAVPGGPPAVRTFTLRNNSTQTALFDAGFVMSGQGFQIVSPSIPIIVQAGGSRDVVIHFSPPAVGGFTDAVTFVDLVGWNNETGTAVAGRGVPGG